MNDWQGRETREFARTQSRRMAGATWERSPPAYGLLTWFVDALEKLFRR